ncbi:hypothetical protein GQR58_020393 [Nymphon striatum]|nr:hypothetical protein GQR58_020393 [Nymphon striatum]
MDVLISGNNEQGMRVFQTTANDLKKLATPVNLFTAFTHNEHGAPWDYEFPSEPTKEQKITSRDKEYQCGGFNNLAGLTQLNDAPIELGNGNIARFRFNNLGIPEDSNISNAYIQFQAGAPGNNGQNNAAAKYYIYTQNTSNAPLVQNGGFGLIGTVEWEPNGGWVEGESGEDQRTPDLSSIIQNIVNKNSWNSGNNGLAIYISHLNIQNPTGSTAPGRRWVNSFDNVSNTGIGTAPTLHVEYSGNDKTKLQVMKESLRAVLEDAPDNVKVGLMNYGQESESDWKTENKRHHNVSGVAFPVTDINAKARDVIATSGDQYGLPSYPDETTTVREYIADIADSWSASSWTPIVDSLYEAALYFRGETIHYGQTLPTKNGAHPVTYDGSAVTIDVEVDGRDRSTAPKYITPMESSCQENYIVLMTDGAPTTNISGGGSESNIKGAFARIRNQTHGPQGALATAVPSCSDPAGVGDAGTCGAELTEYLATNDNMPDPTGSFPEGKEGDQFIKTFTIGFGTGAGTNTETYLKSLATYDDEVGDKRLIRGKNNQNATDELGAFTNSALDYWSDSPNSDPDGKAVEKGGLG